MIWGSVQRTNSAEGEQYAYMLSGHSRKLCVVLMSGKWLSLLNCIIFATAGVDFVLLARVSVAGWTALAGDVGKTVH